MEKTEQAIQVSLAPLDLVSFISSIASLILAIVAIWLSIQFYKMSTQSSKEVEMSTNNINSNVEKLDHLFNKMYSDTFTIVKDTVSDMRDHVYKKDNKNHNTNVEIEKNTKLLVNEIVKEIQEKDGKNKAEIEQLVLEAIEKSKKVEEDLTNKNIEEEILKFLKLNGPTKYSDLNKHLDKKFNTKVNTFTPIENLVKKNEIQNPIRKIGEDYGIYFNETIYLMEK